MAYTQGYYQGGTQEDPISVLPRRYQGGAPTSRTTWEVPGRRTPIPYYLGGTWEEDPIPYYCYSVWRFPGGLEATCSCLAGRRKRAQDGHYSHSLSSREQKSHIYAPAAVNLCLAGTRKRHFYSHLRPFYVLYGHFPLLWSVGASPAHANVGFTHLVPAFKKKADPW